MLAQIGEIGAPWTRVDSIAAALASVGRWISCAARGALLHPCTAAGHDFDLTGFVLREFGVPAIMDNDANVGGIGRGDYGAGRGFDPLFYMTLSTGIGGGIVHEGRVYRGADSYAGEIGHLTIRARWPDCLCGACRLLRAHVQRTLAGTRLR